MFPLNRLGNRILNTNRFGNKKTATKMQVKPSSIQELQEIIRNASQQGTHVSVAGTSYALSAIEQSEAIEISLHELRGIIAVNFETHEVTLAGGTYLHEVGPALREHGYALQGVGSIPEQTITNAVCSAAHGASSTHGSISDHVTAWQWVGADGELHEHRRAHNTDSDDLSNALHLSLGMLGVMIAFTIKVVPIYGLRESHRLLTFDDALNGLIDTAHNSHDMACLLTSNQKVKQTTYHVCDPQPMSKTQHLKDRLNIPSAARSGYSYEVLSTPRRRSYEPTYFVNISEYKAFLSHMNQALVNGTFSDVQINIHKGETGFLSPTQGNDSLVISFKRNKGRLTNKFLEWIKREIQPSQARPNWTQAHLFRNAELRECYPDLDTFLALREQYDPNRTFMSQQLQEYCYGE